MTRKTHNKDVKEIPEKPSTEMPDEEDRKNLEHLLNNYELLYPGEIAQAIEDARPEPGVETKDTAMGKHVMELPPTLADTLEKTYPTLFTNKDHFAWFKENFEQLIL